MRELPQLVPELICSNLETSLDFYIRVIGFEIMYQRAEDKFAYLKRSGVELMLEQANLDDRLYPKKPLEYPFGRGINFEVTVQDFNILHAAIEKEQLPYFMPLEETWYERDTDEIGVRQFAVCDPDGYL